LASDAGTGE
jgi:hypothetical protein